MVCQYSVLECFIHWKYLSMLIHAFQTTQPFIFTFQIPNICFVSDIPSDFEDDGPLPSIPPTQVAASQASASQVNRSQSPASQPADGPATQSSHSGPSTTKRRLEESIFGDLTDLDDLSQEAGQCMAGWWWLVTGGQLLYGTILRESVYGMMRHDLPWHVADTLHGAYISWIFFACEYQPQQCWYITAPPSPAGHVRQNTPWDASELSDICS